MTPEEHLRRWQELHGVEASPLVRAWLRLVLAVSRPVVLPPAVVTLAGLAVALAALAVPLPVAAALVLLSGLLDGVDGCVALLRDRVTAWGGRLDRAVDRVGDVVLAVLLWRAGAPVWLAVATGVAMQAVEGLRVWRRDVLRLTVGERPVRLLLTASALLVAPTAWAAALLVLSVVAVGQLSLAVSRSWPFRDPAVGAQP